MPRPHALNIKRFLSKRKNIPDNTLVGYDTQRCGYNLMCSLWSSHVILSANARLIASASSFRMVRTLHRTTCARKTLCITEYQTLWNMAHEYILWMHSNRSQVVRAMHTPHLAVERPETIPRDFSVSIHLDDGQFLIAAMGTQDII